MKRLILGSLSILLFSAASATSVLAEPPLNEPTRTNSTSTTSQEPSPFDVVYMAYQGQFKNQGIPSAQALIDAHRKGDITAKDIVSSAVQSNRLPSSVMADDDFLNGVEIQLRNLYDSRQ